MYNDNMIKDANSWLFLLTLLNRAEEENAEILLDSDLRWQMIIFEKKKYEILETGILY